MRMTSMLVLVLALFLSAATRPARAEPGSTAEELYQEAYFEENANGDLAKAADLYRKVIETAKEDRELATKARARLERIEGKARGEGPVTVSVALVLEPEMTSHSIQVFASERPGSIAQRVGLFKIDGSSRTSAWPRVLRAVLRCWKPATIEPSIQARPGVPPERMAEAFKRIEEVKTAAAEPGGPPLGEPTGRGPEKEERASVHVKVGPDRLEFYARLVALFEKTSGAITERATRQLASCGGETASADTLAFLLDALLDGGVTPDVALEVEALPGVTYDRVAAVYAALARFGARTGPGAGGTPVRFRVEAAGGELPSATALIETFRILADRLKTAGLVPEEVTQKAESLATGALGELVGGGLGAFLNPKNKGRRIDAAGEAANAVLLKFLEDVFFRPVGEQTFELRWGVAPEDRKLVTWLLTARCEGLKLVPITSTRDGHGVEAPLSLNGETFFLQYGKAIELPKPDRVSLETIAPVERHGHELRPESSAPLLRFGDEDASRIAHFTTEHEHERIAIIADGKVVATPCVNTPSGRDVVLDGLPERQSKVLVAVLGSDPPPLRVTVVDDAR